MSEAAIELGDRVLAFENVVPKTTPFPHFISPQFYTEEFSDALLTWLESDPGWNLKETVLYQQYQLGFSKFRHCKEIQDLWAGAVLARMTEGVSRAFRVAVSGRINISAHMLVPGQQIGIHTDKIKGETHRVVVQLNRGRSDDSAEIWFCFPDLHPKTLMSYSSRHPTRRSGLSSERDPTTQ